MTASEDRARHVCGRHWHQWGGRYIHKRKQGTKSVCKVSSNAHGRTPWARGTAHEVQRRAPGVGAMEGSPAGKKVEDGCEGRQGQRWASVPLQVPLRVELMGLG